MDYCLKKKKITKLLNKHFQWKQVWINIDCLLFGPREAYKDAEALYVLSVAVYDSVVKSKQIVADSYIQIIQKVGNRYGRSLK